MRNRLKLFSRIQIQMKENNNPGVQMPKSPKNNEQDHVKIFAQKLTWRNGQDTAYNVRVIAHRLSQKLKVLNLLQANAPEKKTYGSYRGTHTGTVDKGINPFFGTIRISHRESAPKMQNFNYERQLRYFLIEHCNRLKELVNQKDWQLLIESIFIRHS